MIAPPDGDALLFGERPSNGGTRDADLRVDNDPVAFGRNVDHGCQILYKSAAAGTPTYFPPALLLLGVPDYSWRGLRGGASGRLVGAKSSGATGDFVRRDRSWANPPESTSRIDPRRIPFAPCRAVALGHRSHFLPARCHRSNDQRGQAGLMRRRGNRPRTRRELSSRDTQGGKRSCKHRSCKRG